MDGIHDMGGMHGFGAVEREGDDEPVFHEPWEGRLLAVRMAMLLHTGDNIDQGRYRMERMPPAEYLASRYYERWHHGLLEACRDAGILGEEDLAALRAGRVPEGGAEAEVRLTPEAALGVLATGRTAARAIHASPRFAVGDRVRTLVTHTPEHTRLPRYARGKVGSVVADRGGQVFPDSNAKREGESPERLYTVSFSARELWGEAAHPGDSVTLDLWEPYLEADAP